MVLRNGWVRYIYFTYWVKTDKILFLRHQTGGVVVEAQGSFTVCLCTKGQPIWSNATENLQYCSTNRKESMLATIERYENPQCITYSTQISTQLNAPDKKMGYMEAPPRNPQHPMDTHLAANIPVPDTTACHADALWDKRNLHNSGHN